MDFHPRALGDACEALFDRLGPLDDLRPDLANTIANIYYKFFFDDVRPRLAVGCAGRKGPDRAFERTVGDHAFLSNRRPAD
jgi:hypothetical protein